MSGISGVVSKNSCISGLYYGTDYHSHLGTQYAGLSFVNENGMPIRIIHDLRKCIIKSSYSKSKKEIVKEFI